MDQNSKEGVWRLRRLGKTEGLEKRYNVPEHLKGYDLVKIKDYMILWEYTMAFRYRIDNIPRLISWGNKF